MSLVNKVDNTLLARQTEAVRQMLSFNQVTTVSDKNLDTISIFLAI